MSDDANPARIVCAWCGLLLQDGEGETSHGICDECLPRVLAEAVLRFDDDTPPPGPVPDPPPPAGA